MVSHINKSIRFVITMWILGLILSSNLSFKTEAEQNTQIILSPEKIDISIGESFTLTINATNVESLYTWQVVLKYNGSIINCTDVWIPESNVFAGHNRADVSPGFDRDCLDDLYYMVYSCSLIGEDKVDVANGILFRANFTVKGEGSTSITVATKEKPARRDKITFFNSFLVDNNFNELTFNSNPCIIKAGGVVDVVMPNVRVLSPNGGESLTVGSTYRIRWEATDNVGVSYVHIWLFQGTSQIDVVASSYPNTGYFDWAVPNRPGTNYRIRIAAVDAAGNAGVDDSDAAFTIQTTPMPTPTPPSPIAAPSAAPSLVNPANGASLSGGSVTFSWGSVSGATRYELQVSGPASYDIVDITGTSYTLILSSSGSYTWKVRGYNSAGYGPWSQSWSFTLQVAPSVNWNGIVGRFTRYREMYQTYLSYFLNNEWWQKLADKRAEAAASYNLYQESVDQLFDASIDYFGSITGLPTSLVNHMFLVVDLAESLVRVYNMFLSMYLINVGSMIYAAYTMYDVRVDLDVLIAKTDSVIQAAKSCDYNALTTALTDLKQVTETTFIGLKRFDEAVYNTIFTNPAYDLIPFLTRTNIYSGIRPHIICLRETLILSYADVTFLQGKAEDLSAKRQDGKLTSRWNKPIVKEAYWEVNEIRVTQAQKGQAVNVHTIFRTMNVSMVEYDKVEGTITVTVKKDLTFLPDQEVCQKTWNIQLNPGQTMELVLSFVPDQASSIILRGYFVEVTFSGKYIFDNNLVQNIQVEWDDGSKGAMKDAYPPRLNVQEDSKTSATSGIVLTLQETQHRLYLHVYDEHGRHVGLNYKTNMVETQIPNSQYFDVDNGTTVIILPLNLTNFRVYVDAKYAHDELESYNLTILSIEELEIKDKQIVTANIIKGTNNEYKVQCSKQTEINVEPFKENATFDYRIPVISIVVVAAIVIVALMRRKKHLSMKEKA